MPLALNLHMEAPKIMLFTTHKFQRFVGYFYSPQRQLYHSILLLFSIDIFKNVITAKNTNHHIGFTDSSNYVTFRTDTFKSAHEEAERVPFLTNVPCLKR
jgi:hypothetical protein